MRIIFRKNSLLKLDLKTGISILKKEWLKNKNLQKLWKKLTSLKKINVFHGLKNIQWTEKWGILDKIIWFFRCKKDFSKN